jgi:hypothetical protein
MEHVLGQQGWKPHEAIYVDNTEDDMKTARNGKLLFLNALWHGEANPYGYQFDSPRDIARFVDCFCLGIDDWFWALEVGDLRVYSLAPFSTLSSKYADAQGPEAFTALRAVNATVLDPFRLLEAEPFCGSSPVGQKSKRASRQQRTFEFRT